MARVDELVLLGGALDEHVVARVALLDELALRVRHVEDGLELPVAAGSPRCTTSPPGAA